MTLLCLCGCVRLHKCLCRKGNKDTSAVNKRPLASVVSHNQPLYQNKFYSSIFLQNTFFLSCKREKKRGQKYLEVALKFQPEPSVFGCDVAK